MSALALQVTALGKQYRLGTRERYRTLRDAIANGWRPGASRRASTDAASAFWALKDVGFDVAPGEVVGVIGRNGAGKTTLLKVLSRITPPTEGRVAIWGRVRSLLEVGTGFHAELTGRENIYLNGAILGMRRPEIQRRFDEIVAFADVERFLDTPVKHYSSGMYMRLAFAVAAHLESEILIIDEVLAVGDAAFQKKCLGKMQEVSGSGRTILFVSHNMPTVARLCARVLLLDRGRVMADGAAAGVIAEYLNSEFGSSAARQWPDPATAPGDDLVRLRSARVIDAQGATTGSADVRTPVGIEFVFDILRQDSVALIPMMALYADDGGHVFNALDPDPRWSVASPPGRYRVTAWIPGNLLTEGTMIASVFVNAISPGKVIKHAHAPDAVAFQVIDPVEGDSARGQFVGAWGGAVRPLLRWSLTVDDAVPRNEMPHRAPV